ncbi:DUF6518 family protein [Nocardioides litoris]|uniref:DUF6518 family protein n=1 Tax=Nocardioides litoris TaxID=1926648 RepID=UPI001120EF97|nr:DUF6518 family protein [Nocardioides litoris]
MTTYEAPVLTGHARSAHPAVRRPLLVAAGAGVALGVVDLALQLSLPYPLADLANSSAVWAVLALVLARVLGTGEVRSALAGVVALVVAVEAYYLAAIALDKAAVTSLVAPTSVAWMVMGVVAGAGFGVAGAWSRRGRSWWAAAGIGAGVAVLLAEAWQRSDQPGTALLTAGLGAALLAATARQPVLLGRTVVAAVALTPVCFVLFGFAGFGG